MIEQILGSMSGIFWIFLIIIPLLLLKALLKNPKIKGSMGEIAVRSVIGKNLDEKTYSEFHDLIIHLEMVRHKLIIFMSQFLGYL